MSGVLRRSHAICHQGLVSILASHAYLAGPSKNWDKFYRYWSCSAVFYTSYWPSKEGSVKVHPRLSKWCTVRAATPTPPQELPWSDAWWPWLVKQAAPRRNRTRSLKLRMITLLQSKNYKTFCTMNIKTPMLGLRLLAMGMCITVTAVTGRYEIHHLNWSFTVPLFTYLYLKKIRALKPILLKWKSSCRSMWITISHFLTSDMWFSGLQRK